jgi:small subunit ribosomal protein S6
MPGYETLCILHPELLEARVKELGSWMQKIVESANGTVGKVDQWGLRDLAYDIKKQRRGHYVRLEYEASAEAVRELERNLRISDDVLRFLSVAQEPQVQAAEPQTPTASAPTQSTPAPSVEETTEEQQ